MNKIKGYFKKLYDIIITPSMSYLPGNLSFFLVLSILWMCVIFYMSNQPATISSNHSGNVINIISSIMRKMLRKFLIMSLICSIRN